MKPEAIRKSPHTRSARILDFLRELFWDERLLKSFLTKPAMPLWGFSFRVFSLPGLRNLHPWFSPSKNSFSWLPVNQLVQAEGGTALPEQVLYNLIDRASHRIILNLCGCRQTNGCTSYPRELGCLMMGEDALLFPEKIRREVGPEEARAHVEQALRAGLVPIAGKARIDNEIFLMPDRGRLLTVCFCCECCCISRFYRYLPSHLLDTFYHPVQGLIIETTDACTGCGLCEEKCYIGAVRVGNGRSVRNDMCRGCGRCATFCPEGAVRLTLENPDAADEIIRRIDAYVDY